MDYGAEQEIAVYPTEFTPMKKTLSARWIPIYLLLCGSAVAAEPNLDLQGATITGNRELPKVLYIVPWKKPDPADLGADAGPSAIDDVLAPVDREVFERQLEYYDALHSQ